MTLDLYLVVTDRTGAVVPGAAVPARLADPFRGGGLVTARPFLAAGYTFGGAVTTSTGGGTTGRVDIDPLVVDMPDDTSAAVLFQALTQNALLKSVDMLAVATGDKPVVVSGVALDDAVLTAATWTVTNAGLVRRLTFDSRIVTVGSAPLRKDGTYGPFASYAYDTVG